MRDEVLTVVRLPIAQLAAEVKTRNKLDDELFDARIDGDSLILSFKRTSGINPRSAPAPRSSSLSQPSGGRRRRKTKRNRMKTRGWAVAAKIQNARGQTAVIYKPFVDALFGKALTPAQQRAAVASILRSNGNDPNEASVEYFLENTLEYLRQANK
jgi:hypothetical protein